MHLCKALKGVERLKVERFKRIIDKASLCRSVKVQILGYDQSLTLTKAPLPLFGPGHDLFLRPVLPAI